MKKILMLLAIILIVNKGLSVTSQKPEKKAVSVILDVQDQKNYDVTLLPATGKPITFSETKTLELEPVNIEVSAKDGIGALWSATYIKDIEIKHKKAEIEDETGDYTLQKFLNLFKSSHDRVRRLSEKKGLIDDINHKLANLDNPTIIIFKNKCNKPVEAISNQKK
jgi:hypothetical protein